VTLADGFGGSSQNQTFNFGESNLRNTKYHKTLITMVVFSVHWKRTPNIWD
jgi:hypothetical protein